MFCAADSIAPVAYYPELLKYHSCAERIGDSTKAKMLLYRLVQSNGFDRESFDAWLGGFNLQARSYWPELDSLIQITESRRCRPFIDSLDAMVRKDQGVRMRIEAEGWTEDIRDQMKAATLSQTDHQTFFEWLLEQVNMGNYHLFDYAELYDDVHHRLFGESYYGQKLFVPDVPLYDPQRVDERRSAIWLPPLEVWQGIKKHVSHIE